MPDSPPARTEHPAPSTQHPERSTQHLAPGTFAYLAWVTVCLVWGTTYLGIRIALESIPPFSMAAMRWLAAGAILIVMLKARGERLPPREAWPSLAILGILLLGFGNGGVVWAEQSVPSGLTAVLVSTIPFWMVAIERFMPTAERLTPRRLAGLAIGFVGIVILVWPEIQRSPTTPSTSFGTGTFFGGVVATQLACFGWAIGSSYARRRRHDENVLGAAAVEMIIAGVCLLAPAAIRGEWSELSFTPRTSGALAYLILAGSVVGFSAYAYALKHLPLTTVSLYAYINPVIAVVLGTLMLREPFSARIAIAGAVVLAGMAMVRESS
jgi:drug/metabolite transporter (DMT)-like permease